MLRISLIIALIAGLATGAIGIVKVKEKIVTTMNDRDTEKGMKEVAQKDLAKTKTDLKNTDEKLKVTEQSLAATEAELRNVTSRSEELEKQRTELAETLEQTRADRNTAQQELMKWEIVDIKPEQVILAPDCGMKYLPRAVADGKLKAMVEAAQLLRDEYASH